MFIILLERKMMKKNFARSGGLFSKKDIYKCPFSERGFREWQKNEKSDFPWRWSDNFFFHKLFVTINFYIFIEFALK